MEAQSFSRRRFLKLTAGTSAVALLSACVAPTTTAPAADSGAGAGAPAAEGITLAYLNRGGQYIADVARSQMELYRERNPHINFSVDEIAGAFHQESLLLQISSGTPPDIWFDAPRTTGPFTRRGLTVNFEPYFEADPNFNEDDYVPNGWTTSTYDGARWGIPWDAGAMAVAFNKRHFDEAGIPHPTPDTWMTWDELVELAKQLTLDLDGNTPNDPGFDPARVKQYGFAPDRTLGRHTYTWSNNAEIINPDGTMPMDSPEYIEAMNWMADLGLVHYVSPSPAYEPAGEVSIQAGTLAMQHTGAWQIGRINAAGIEWGVFPVPYSKTRVSYGHYSPLCIYSGSNYKQECYDYIAWACGSQEGEKILVESGMIQPIRKDLRETFINAEGDPAPEYRQVFFDAFENEETFRWPGDTIGSYLGAACQTFLDYWAPFQDRLWLGEIRWEDVAAEVRAGSEQILQTGEMP